MKRGLIAVVLLAVLAGLGYYAFSRNAAPDVSYRTLDGRVLTQASLRDKVVLVNFWATSCPGCVKEMPEMKKMYQTLAPKGLEIVAVAMSYDPPAYVKTYAEKNALPFPVALDTDGSVARAFGDVQLTPTTFLVGRDGKVLKRYVGVMDFAEVEHLIAQNL